jgi:radical SAM protein with 4Fe4S-binding SPASM domain
VRNKKKILPSVSEQIKADYLKAINSKTDLICTAPFTGLYFTPDGTVKPCCTLLNKNKFGTYPENSIKEILKSENRKALQKHIKKDNLEFGCQNCLQSINNGNYNGSISSLYQKYKKGKYPKVIDFELSHFCNLDCEMCFLHTDVNSKSDIYNENFLKEITPYIKRAESTRFYGGEPFLIKIYKDIWDIIIKKNPKCHVHIQTNATIFNNYVNNLLHKMDAFIGVSLDAMNPELYEDIRRGAKFENVKDNIMSFNQIMKSQNKLLTISFCPMPKNWQELIPVVMFAESIGANIFFNTVIFPAEYSLKYLPSNYLIKIRDTIKSDFEKNISCFKINNLEISSFLISLNKIITKQVETEKNHKWMNIEEFCELLGKKTNEKQLSLEVLKLLKQNEFKGSISPYIVAEICSNSSENIASLLKKIINKMDYDYAKKLLWIADYQ